MAKEKVQQTVQTTETTAVTPERTINFDAERLLKQGDCKFMSDHNAEIKLDFKIVRMIASTSKGATISDTECLMFIRTCEIYKLDPLLKEIYLIKYDMSKPAQIVIAADVFLRIADSHPDYYGYETGWIVEVAGKGRACLKPFCPIEPNQTIIGSWCKVSRGDRSTPVYETLIREVNKGQSTWVSMPQTMTVKCNVAQAHRKAFPNLLGTIYSADERPDLFERNVGQEFPTDSMPQTTPRAGRTPDEPVTITLDMVRKALVKEFYEHCYGINPDVSEAGIQEAFYNFMATQFGGDINKWIDLMDDCWTINVCDRAMKHLEEVGISNGLAGMFLGIRLEPESQPEATGEMLLPADESGVNNG